MKILSYNYTKPISEKYSKIILKVATLEERIKTLMDFGMVDESTELGKKLIKLIETVRDEFENDKKR